MNATARDIARLVAIIAPAKGVPASLGVALAWQESRFNRWAISRAGAMGVCQLMYLTAVDMGVKDPFDTVQNITGGMRYLAIQYQRFGTWELALAAYNAGPKTVAKLGRVPNIPETKAYVAAVMAKASALSTPKV